MSAVASIACSRIFSQARKFFFSTMKKNPTRITSKVRTKSVSAISAVNVPTTIETSARAACADAF